jgi:acyl carrier protein
MESIESTVRSFILKQFLPDANPDELTESTPLVTGGILDSMATVRLIMFLEQHFHIDIPPHEVTAQNLANVARIAALVRIRQKASGA